MHHSCIAEGCPQTRAAECPYGLRRGAGLWSSRASGLGFTVFTAVLEAEALAIHFQDVDMMGQAIKKCTCEAL